MDKKTTCIRNVPGTHGRIIFQANKKYKFVKTGNDSCNIYYDETGYMSFKGDRYHKYFKRM